MPSTLSGCVGAAKKRSPRERRCVSEQCWLQHAWLQLREPACSQAQTEEQNGSIGTLSMDRRRLLRPECTTRTNWPSRPRKLNSNSACSRKHHFEDQSKPVHSVGCIRYSKRLRIASSANITIAGLTSRPCPIISRLSVSFANDPEAEHNDKAMTITDLERYMYASHGCWESELSFCTQTS